MMGALYSAASGMQAQQLNIDVISNNLANVNTPGFKRQRAEFQDLLYRTATAAGVPVSQGTSTPVGQQVGTGVRPVATTKIFSQGDFEQTGNPLDLTIQGDGFFQIQQNDGTIAYTRDGSFKVDRDGTVVNDEGLPLSPQITIPQDAQNITVSPEGVITAQVNGQQNTIGQISLVRFMNPAGLSSAGGNLLLQTQASGDPQESLPEADGTGSILQGYLEQSNVRVVDEMVNLITAQRAYEANSKAIQTSDTMLSEANQLKQ